jgi:hypothetical protein
LREEGLERGGCIIRRNKIEVYGEGGMKRRFPVGMVRVLFALVVLAGSIVTFNFGLNEGLNPADYLRRQGDCCDYLLRSSLDLTTRLVGLGGTLALLLMLIGAFGLWRTLLKHDREMREGEKREVGLSYSWAVPRPRRMRSVSPGQQEHTRTKVRVYNKIRL